MRSLFAVMTGVMLLSAAAAVTTGWSWAQGGQVIAPAATISAGQR